MLNNAIPAYAQRLRSILQQATLEQRTADNLGGVPWREDTAAYYVACYALIRVGNVVALHSRRLEQVYPNYPWSYWVDLRNQLAHSHLTNEVNPGDVYLAIESSLPGLIQAITGRRPPLSEQG